jgi:hypothetical protein
MPAGITRITIEGYKSIVKEQSIKIAPLTILAGANSSGKSSMIQPLLLLKQTLEAPFDAGSAVDQRPILKYTFSDQLVSPTGGESYGRPEESDFAPPAVGRNAGCRRPSSWTRLAQHLPKW